MISKLIYLQFLTAIILLTSCDAPVPATQGKKLKALILDGHNNHYVWPKTTQMMKSYLEETGLFEVDVKTPECVWIGHRYNKNRPESLKYFVGHYLDTITFYCSFDPLRKYSPGVNFSDYEVIISNLGNETPSMSDSLMSAFDKYMTSGGGLVIIHAADNAWGDWPAFNQMIGLGAWGDRDSLSGPYVYLNEDGQIEKDHAAGPCGSHGTEHEYKLTNRSPEHPIMKGLPSEWLHTKDELYDRLRGPFSHATVLASAYSDVEKNSQTWDPHLKGSGRHVPVIMTIEYGKGRIFHSTMGHFDYSQECVGFITTFQRGAEWVVTGGVTQEVPDDFPKADQTSSRIWKENSL